MLDKFLPPTDNLYKFVCISGLMLIVLSYLPFYYGMKLDEMIIEAEKQNELLRFEAQGKDTTLESDYEKWEKVVESGESPEKVFGTNSTVNLLKRLKKNLAISEAIIPKSIELDANTKLLKLYLNYYVLAQKMSYSILIFGLVLTIVGFWLWYLKVQYPNDLILRNQINADNLKEKRKRPNRLKV